MFKNLDKVIVFSFILVLSACAGGPHPTQQEVARDFWTAMETNDLAKAKTYAKKGTMDSVSPNNDAKMDKVEIKPSKVENGLNVVPTTVTATQNGEQKTTSFNTVLEQEDGEWKVDFEKTSTSIMGFSMQDMMEGMGKAMGDAMKGVGEAVGKGLSDGEKTLDQ
ncbi:MAG: hypothetical protein IPN42_13315 [Methylococcaceae bacterium]|nr:hypothetical protein [Methylococcaceae bacterium]